MIKLIKFLFSLVMVLADKVNELKEEVMKLKRDVDYDVVWKIAGVQLGREDSSKECDLFVKIGDSELSMKFTIFHGEGSNGEYWSCMHPMKTRREGGGYWYNCRVGSGNFTLSKKQVQDIENSLIDAWKKCKGEYEKRYLPGNMKHNDCSSCVYSRKKEIGMEHDSGKIESICYYCVLKGKYLNEEFVKKINELEKRGEIKKVNGKYLVRKNRELSINKLIPQRLWKEDSLGICRHYCAKTQRNNNVVIYPLAQGRTYWSEEYIAEVPLLASGKRIIVDCSYLAGKEDKDFKSKSKEYKWFNSKHNTKKEYVAVTNLKGENIEVRAKHFQVKYTRFDEYVDSEVYRASLDEVKELVRNELENNEDYREAFIHAYPKGFDIEASIWDSEKFMDKDKYYKQAIAHILSSKDYPGDKEEIEEVSYQDWMSGKISSESQVAQSISSIEDKIAFKLEIEEKYGKEFSSYEEMLEFLDNEHRDKGGDLELGENYGKIVKDVKERFILVKKEFKRIIVCGCKQDGWEVIGKLISTDGMEIEFAAKNGNVVTSYTFNKDAYQNRLIGKIKEVI